MPRLPFLTKFYTDVPYHSTLWWKKTQNGWQAAILVKKFNSQYLHAAATILNQILHNCYHKVSGKAKFGGKKIQNSRQVAIFVP